MCYSYAFSAVKNNDKMAVLLSVMERKYPGAYKTGDIFPGDTAPAILARQGKILAVPAIFGFPGFQNGRLLINARGETAAEKKSFADSMKERRILLPATGFYEFDAKKTRYQFSTDASSVFYLCGLYRIEEGLPHFVVLTREPGEEIRFIHDRMPLILPESAVEDWIRPETRPEDLLALARTEPLGWVKKFCK